jgi:hypothetical protein
MCQNVLFGRIFTWYVSDLNPCKKDQRRPVGSQCAALSALHDRCTRAKPWPNTVPTVTPAVRQCTPGKLLCDVVLPAITPLHLLIIAKDPRVAFEMLEHAVLGAASVLVNVFMPGFQVMRIHDFALI